MSKPLSKYLDDFYWYSGKASDVMRTAAFAGIALVWVFRLDTKPIATLPKPLVLPALSFATAVAADVLQYVAGTIIWFVFHLLHELRASGEDPELSHSRWLTVPTWFFFVVKLAAIEVGYFSVLRYLAMAWPGLSNVGAK